MRLLLVLAKPSSLDWSRPWLRLRRVFLDGFLQRRMLRWSWPGLAHVAIFLGFLVFLPRTLVLLGRAFDADFGQCVASHDAVRFAFLRLGYDWLKTTMAVVVLVAVASFAVLRFRRFEERLEPKLSALGILAAIAAMMIADLLYEASAIALARRGWAGSGELTPPIAQLASSLTRPFVEVNLRQLDPVMSRLVELLPRDAAVLLTIGLISYGVHLTLVGAFLVSLPYSKHFHLITIWPKLFFADRSPGALHAVAKSEQALCELVEASLEAENDPDGTDGAAVHRAGHAVIGKQSLGDYSVTERLDLFACTQCGRCTASCPAALTGKVLDPRRINQKLRTHLQRAPLPSDALKSHLLAPIVPNLLEPEAVWACTNCGACEEACPVDVRFVAPIVDLRRDLLLMRAEAPIELQRTFNALERTHNPYGFPHEERTQWAQGLGVPLLKDVAAVEYLFWVGCAASYDERAKSVARSLVQLMRRADVSFAILGPEEHCTGDAARRAGNELLYLQLAEHNIALLNGYRTEGRFRRIVTVCPHCLVTIGQQYPELGGTFEVMSHVTAIAHWIEQGRLVLTTGESRNSGQSEIEQGDVTETLTYHDPCNLARIAGIVDEPRRIMSSIDGVRMLEATRHGKDGFCCGAGGSQIWLEEHGRERINERRFAELSATQARRIVTACPFCLSMLGEGAKTRSADRATSVTDIAELIESRAESAVR